MNGQVDKIQVTNCILSKQQTINNKDNKLYTEWNLLNKTETNTKVNYKYKTNASLGSNQRKDTMNTLEYIRPTNNIKIYIKST